MVREDPSLVVEVDDESGQTVLKGIGELHLEVGAGGAHDKSDGRKNQNLTHKDYSCRQQFQRVCDQVCCARRCLIGVYIGYIFNVGVYVRPVSRSDHKRSTD